MNIFKVISGPAVSILLESYLPSLVLYLGEEGPSPIIRWDLASGCHLHKVVSNHFHLGSSLCVRLHPCALCVCAQHTHICEGVCLCLTGDQCAEVEKNWEYQVYKEHRPQRSSL